MAGSSDTARPRNPWPHRLAVVTAGATVVLIVVGGLVTNTGSALAVPDWPTTFGHNMFLFPWSHMVGGVFYEHSHRLIGSTVGLLTVALAVCLWLTEPRAWVRQLGLVAVVAVIVQGILGGLRVVLLEHGLAPVHGCVAQAFLALMVSIAVVTSPTWDAGTHALASTTSLRALARITAPLVYMQMVFGALLTHTGTRLDMHLLGAALVSACVGLLAGRILYDHAERAELRRPVLVLLALVIVQLGLGIGAYLWRFTMMSAALPGEVGLAILTAHRLTGTAVWATSVVLALRARRRSGAAAAVATRLATEHSFSKPPRREVLA